MSNPPVRKSTVGIEQIYLLNLNVILGVCLALVASRDYYLLDTKLVITDLLYAGDSLGRARETFAAATQFRPGRPYTIRQGIRVLANWPGSR